MTDLPQQRHEVTESSLARNFDGQFVPDDIPAQYVRSSKLRRRIWSSTGEGELVSPGASRQKLFLKQFVDRSGNPDERGFDEEIRFHEMTREVLGSCLYVPQLLLTDKARLLLGYEFVDCITFDELLRQDQMRFAREFDALLPRLIDILEALAKSHIRTKLEQSPMPGAADVPATIFPGRLELRNIGVWKNGYGAFSANPCVFDLGRPYAGRVADASADFLLSVGLLNWGRPLRRFMAGPDTAMLDKAWRVLRPYSDPAAVVRRFEREENERTNRIKAANSVETATKKIGMRLLGRRYLRALASYARGIS